MPNQALLTAPQPEVFTLHNLFFPAGEGLAHRAMAGVVAAANGGQLPLFASTLGMSFDEFSVILSEEAKEYMRPAPLHTERLAEWRPVLFPHLVEMLWNHQSCDDKVNWWVAHAIASACFGQRHLWQDLRLRGRDEIARLLEERFYRLYIGNIHDLKWKMFFFQELGNRLGLPGLKPPGCSACDQYRLCWQIAPPRSSMAG
jgi:nitrogen fixation protein NifQ